MRLITLKFNAARSNIRYEILNGKKYLVTHGTLIVPGVLDGNRGPLLYKAKDIASSVDAWNGMPIVLNHPHKGDRPVSARTPEVLHEYGMGMVLRSRLSYNKKLVAQLWFDMDAVSRISPELLEDLKSGKSIELSTGLYTRNIRAKSGSTFNGKQYTHIAKQYKPDHLAILPHNTGACSVRDGCGVNVINVLKHGDSGMKLTAAKRKKIIDSLIANCDCWKGKGDKAILQEMDDQKLIGFNNLRVRANRSTAVFNAVREELEIEDETELTPELVKATLKTKLAANLSNDDIEPDLEDEDAEEEAETQVTPARTPKQAVKVKGKVKTPVVNTPAKKTAQEWLDEAPEEVRDMIGQAKEIHTEKKNEIIGKLVANVKDKTKRAAKIKTFQGMKLAMLKELLDLLPTPTANKRSIDSLFDEDDEIPDFSGAATGDHVTNSDDDDDEDDDDILPIPSLNSYDEEEVDEEEDERPRKPSKRRQRA